MLLQLMLVDIPHTTVQARFRNTKVQVNVHTWMAFSPFSYMTHCQHPHYIMTHATTRMAIATTIIVQHAKEPCLPLHACISNVPSHTATLESTTTGGTSLMKSIGSLPYIINSYRIYRTRLMSKWPFSTIMVVQSLQRASFRSTAHQACLTRHTLHVQRTVGCAGTTSSRSTTPRTIPEGPYPAHPNDAAAF